MFHEVVRGVFFRFHFKVYLLKRLNGVVQNYRFCEEVSRHVFIIIKMLVMLLLLLLMVMIMTMTMTTMMMMTLMMMMMTLMLMLMID